MQTMFFLCCCPLNSNDVVSPPPPPPATPPASFSQLIKQKSLSAPALLSNKNSAKVFIDRTNYTTVEYRDCVPFVPPLTHGKVIKVYDGDTITVASRFYEDSPLYRFSIRLLGIDTPEIKSRNPIEKSRAIAARNALSKLIVGSMVTLENCQTEKYGRVLADVFLEGLHVNQWMLDEGYAVKYDGKTKAAWNFMELDDVSSVSSE